MRVSYKGKHEQMKLHLWVSRKHTEVYEICEVLGCRLDELMDYRLDYKSKK